MIKILLFCAIPTGFILVCMQPIDARRLFAFYSTRPQCSDCRPLPMRSPNKCARRVAKTSRRCRIKQLRRLGLFRQQRSPKPRCINPGFDLQHRMAGKIAKGFSSPITAKSEPYHPPAAKSARILHRSPYLVACIQLTTKRALWKTLALWAFE